LSFFCRSQSHVRSFSRRLLRQLSAGRFVGLLRLSRALLCDSSNWWVGCLEYCISVRSLLYSCRLQSDWWSRRRSLVASPLRYCPRCLRASRRALLGLWRRMSFRRCVHRALFSIWSFCWGLQFLSTVGSQCLASLWTLFAWKSCSFAGSTLLPQVSCWAACSLHHRRRLYFVAPHPVLHLVTHLLHLIGKSHPWAGLLLHLLRRFLGMLHRRYPRTESSLR